MKEDFRDLHVPYGAEPDKYIVWVFLGLKNASAKNVVPVISENSSRVILSTTTKDGTPTTRRILFD